MQLNITTLSLSYIFNALLVSPALCLLPLHFYEFTLVQTYNNRKDFTVVQ